MAVLYSFGLPGAGHIYLGRRTLGIIELMIALVLVSAGVNDVVQATFLVINHQIPVWEIGWTALSWAPALIGYSILSGIFTWLVSRNVCLPGKRIN